MLPFAGQRQLTPPTERAPPADTGGETDCGGATSPEFGLPATGTTTGVVDARASREAEIGLCGGNPGAGALERGAIVVVTDVGAVLTDLKTGAAGTPVNAVSAWAFGVGRTGSDLFDGDSRSRCPGQIVYGGEMSFQCARSRKSMPFLNAIEYRVSPLMTR